MDADGQVRSFFKEGSPRNPKSSIKQLRTEKWINNKECVDSVKETIKQLFDLEHCDDLKNLHELQSQHLLQQNSKMSRRRKNKAGRNLYDKIYHEHINSKSDKIQLFCEAYENFIRKVCASEMELREGCGEVLLYQRYPTMRVMFPNTGKIVGKIHKDADYHHQINEINFWVPFVDLRDHPSACLYAESEPNKH